MATPHSCPFLLFPLHSSSSPPQDLVPRNAFAFVHSPHLDTSDCVLDSTVSLRDPSNVVDIVLRLTCHFSCPNGSDLNDLHRARAVLFATKPSSDRLGENRNETYKSTRRNFGQEARRHRHIRQQTSKARYQSRRIPQITMASDRRRLPSNLSPMSLHETNAFQIQNSFHATLADLNKTSNQRHTPCYV